MSRSSPCGASATCSRFVADTDSPSLSRSRLVRASNPSLRVHLLRALATPLFALVLVSGSLSYWLAAHYTTQVFDRALYGVANNIAQQIRIAGPRLDQDIPMIAQTLVEAEGSDRIYWRIHGPDGLIEIGRAHV